jgi:hypothetical protein
LDPWEKVWVCVCVCERDRVRWVSTLPMRSHWSITWPFDKYGLRNHWLQVLVLWVKKLKSKELHKCLDLNEQWMIDSEMCFLRRKHSELQGHLTTGRERRAPRLEEVIILTTPGKSHGNSVVGEGHRWPPANLQIPGAQVCLFPVRHGKAIPSMSSRD